MKTVIIFDETNDTLRFAVVDGDYSHLNDVYINCFEIPEELQDELSDLMYDENYNYRQEMLSVFPTEAVLAGAKVIVSGFLA